MLTRFLRNLAFTAKGLGFKLFLLFTFLLLACFAFMMYIYISNYTDQLEKNVIHHATQVSGLAKRSTRYSMLKNHREDLANIIDNIGKEEGVEGVLIYNKEGVIQFSSHPEILYQTLGMDAEQCVFCHQSDKAKGTIPEENRYRYLESEEGYRILGMINPIDNEPSCSSASCHAHGPDEKLLGLLDIQMSLEEVDLRVAETRQKIIWISCVAVALTAALFWGLIHFFVRRPISKLIEGTKQVANMNLEYTIDVNSKDEIGVLANSFNRMTGELKRANEAVQEWSSTMEEKVHQKTQELKQAQDHLILVEKMASLGKLSAMVAHEINNPMAGILNYAKLSIRTLERGTDGDRVNDTLENLNVIRDEAKRCGDIVKNMLLFSRKTAGEMYDQDLNAIVKRSVELVRHSFEVKSVGLVLDLESEALQVPCDPDGIQQMLLAILINALEAISSEACTARVRTRRRAEENKVRITVSDNGPGIPEEVLSHIFEPFFTTKDSERSTGLGLSVVYGIVERHEGKISVNSKVGEGTTFTIDLPERTSSGEEAGAAEHGSEPASGSEV